MDDFEKNAFLLWLSFVQLAGVMLFADRLAEPGLGEAVLVGCMSSQVLLHILLSPDHCIHRWVASDPSERHNLARSNPSLLSELRAALLDARRGAWSDPSPLNPQQQCNAVRGPDGHYPITARASRGLCESYVAAPAGGGRGWVPCRWSERTLSCEKGPPRECA